MNYSVESAELGYAPVNPQRHRWICPVLVILFVAGCVYGGRRWGPQAWRQVRILYWQRMCLRYTAPDSMVVYEEDLTAAAALLKPGSNYASYPIQRRTVPIQAGAVSNAAAFYPRAWMALQTAAKLNPAGPLLIMGAGPMPAVPAKGAIIFLHELVAPNGNHRLVAVEYDPEADTFTGSFIQGYNYRATAIDPATWTKPPTQILKSWDFDVMSGYPLRPPLVRVYAGQIDPADSAHFTFRYQMWGQTDIADGRLGNDDSVTLTQRNAPKWK